MKRRRGRAAISLGLALGVLPLLAAPAGARERDRPTPSGLPVPRWVSLKFGTVNARSGPGDDYPTVWVYSAKHLPVQIVAETREWRKVCDSDGQSAWVHRRTVDGVRTVFRARPGALALSDDPQAGSRVAAYLKPRSVADLDKCDGGWCRLKIEGVTAWAPARELWGVDESPVCR